MYSAAERRNVPAEKRGISMVFQSYAVWPHMSVFDNVAYGLRVRKLPRAEVAAQVERALDLVQMRRICRPLGLAACRAASSSASRWPAPSRSRRRCCCSTSRYRTSTPNCAPRCGSNCASLQRRLGITSVYVTHDQEEALAISDRVIVMHVGGIEQIGTPGGHLSPAAHPLRRRFRRLGQPDRGPGRGRRERRRRGARSRAPAAGAAGLAAQPPRGGEDTVAVRTAHIALSPDGAARRGRANAPPAQIRQRLFHGDFIQYVVDWPAGTPDRPPPADRPVRGRRRRHGLLLRRTLRAAGGVGRQYWTVSSTDLAFIPGLISLSALGGRRGLG